MFGAVTDITALYLRAFFTQHFYVAVVRNEHKAAYYGENAHRHKGEIHIISRLHLIHRTQHAYDHGRDDYEQRAHAQGDEYMPTFVLYHTL